MELAYFKSYSWHERRGLVGVVYLSLTADLYLSPDLDSSPDLSPFLLDSDLGRFVTKSTFYFHCAHLQCFV